LLKKSGFLPVPGYVFRTAHWLAGAQLRINLYQAFADKKYFLFLPVNSRE
jgi:hypothetical protein